AVPRGKQSAREALGDAPRGGIDDRELIAPAEQLQERIEPRTLVLDRDDAEPEVRPVEGAHMDGMPTRREAEGLHDVAAHLGSGAARQRDGLRIAQLVPGRA